MIDSAFGEKSLGSDGRRSTAAQYLLKLTPSIMEVKAANEAGSLDGEL